MSGLVGTLIFKRYPLHWQLLSGLGTLIVGRMWWIIALHGDASFRTMCLLVSPAIPIAIFSMGFFASQRLHARSQAASAEDREQSTSGPPN
jgi:hypothetical protein